MIDLDDLLAIGGRLAAPPVARRFTGFSYDSRLTNAGELFLALRTPRGDGHAYIADALASGATGVVCETLPVESANATIIIADDPALLAARWASARLRQVAPLVVGVTGSVGKTSTTRAIAAVLSAMAPTFRSRRSFNSLIGLPVSLAHLKDDHRFAVLEYGTAYPGELRRLVTLFPPHVAVVTSASPMRLSAFGSVAGLAREFGVLVAALPADGWAVLNGDDPAVATLRTMTRARVLTFGTGAGCDLRAEVCRYSLDGTEMRLVYGDASVDAVIPLIGEPAVGAALAAIGVGLACGMSLERAAARLAYVEPPAGRLRPHPARNGAVLLDDTVGAEPSAMLAALRTLATLPARRRIAVLGDLPADSSDPSERNDVYAMIGTLAAQVADVLIWKGDAGTPVIRVAQRIRPDLPVTVVYTIAAALESIPSDLGAGDLILVCGGAAARMERLVAALVAPSVNVSQALVRQDAGWRATRIADPDRPTWVRVDLDAIRDNVRTLRAIAGVPLMAVLKADAYGHGAVRAARAALAGGASALAVATLGEARTLREAGIGAPILALGYTPPWQVVHAARLGVAITVFDSDTARACAAAAETGLNITVHVEVDTGMARTGLSIAELGPFLRTLADMPGVRIEGLYTHFADADAPDLSAAEAQLRRFCTVVEAITAAGMRPPIVHAANSAALLRLPGARFDMVRPGIACYGLSPSPWTPLPPTLRPALSFHAEVAQVRDLPPETPVSYGGAFITRRTSRIATIPVGYADGLRRSPAWREVLVRGQRAPIVGRICMDYAMIDVTDIPGVRRGDLVTLIGAQGDARLTADEVAEWLGTISYDVVATILPRVPREIGE
ncbi:MAG: alanine racemase [Roseiflexus sp.]|nr:alanine racemase [Roseiflexus sp.]MCS7288291.1 alanine racemase [Roseiflexus sp.]MDW8148903.1 alanine racemase [Roseiflexaceae bacterium]MDW8233449.1 alanine racemase [Roseiflexaceae bacterium]